MMARTKRAAPAAVKGKAAAKGKRPPAEGEPAAVTAGKDSRQQLDQLAALGDRFAAGGWRPAKEVLVPVRAVPTIFPSVDLVTRVGGWPTDRIALVHGASGEGKTLLCHGIGLSYLKRGHAYAFVDAEYTSPDAWLQSLMRDMASSPGFRALRPRTYEETVEAVENFCTTIAEARQRREVAEDTTALVVVDSIRKLVPKRLLETMMREDADADDAKGSGGRKKKPGGVDGMSGRAAQYKAALNSAWMDRLVPLLGQTGCGMILIAREYEDAEAAANPFSGKDWKVGGGRAIYYDSSLVVRVTRAGYVQEPYQKGRDPIIYGERHAVEVHKTKVGTREEKVPEAFFHTSNGHVGPVGFDLARDLLQVGIERSIVTKAGSHLAFGRRRLGQGEHNAVARLYEDAALMADLEAAVREEVRLSLEADARTRGEEVETPVPSPVERETREGKRKPSFARTEEEA